MSAIAIAKRATVSSKTLTARYSQKSGNRIDHLPEARIGCTRSQGTPRARPAGHSPGDFAPTVRPLGVEIRHACVRKANGRGPRAGLTRADACGIRDLVRDVCWDVSGVLRRGLLLLFREPPAVCRSARNVRTRHLTPGWRGRLRLPGRRSPAPALLSLCCRSIVKSSR